MSNPYQNAVVVVLWRIAKEHVSSNGQNLWSTRWRAKRVSRTRRRATGPTAPDTQDPIHGAHVDLTRKVLLQSKRYPGASVFAVVGLLVLELLARAQQPADQREQ